MLDQRYAQIRDGTLPPHIEEILSRDPALRRQMLQRAAEDMQHHDEMIEIFERNLGADTPLKLVRGLNNLWTNGGLIYAPPYR